MALIGISGKIGSGKDTVGTIIQYLTMPGFGKEISPNWNFHFDKKNNKWLSKITINNKPKHLGRFHTELEAYNFRQNYILNNNLAEFYN